ncbi:MAG: hypothetical protein J3Q66DRAFT_24205 [Benniella sp.]|nr:MAG: hypothetical protein J3Q66DRAFT_24205 [Benniella sp.]
MATNSMANNNSVRLGAAVLVTGLVLYLIWSSTSKSSSSPKPPAGSSTTTRKTVKTVTRTVEVSADKSDDDEEGVVDGSETVVLSFEKKVTTNTAVEVKSEESVGQTDAAAEVAVVEPAKQALPIEKKEETSEASVTSVIKEQVKSTNNDLLAASEEVVVVSRELQLSGDSIEHVQVTTIHEHKSQQEEDQSAVEIHSDIKVLDTEASKSVIEEFVEQVQTVVEDQKVEALDQSFVEIERLSFSELQADKVEEDQELTQTVATEESSTLSFESAYVVREQEQERELEQQQESSGSSESEQEKEEEKVEAVVVEQSTVELSHTEVEEEQTLAEISITTSSSSATTDAMEEHIIQAYTKLEEHEVEEAEDALELDEQKAAEVDAMVNDEDIVHVSHNDSYIQEDRVDTTFYSAQPLDLISPKRTSSEEFPGQREAAERIDKALAIAEAASPYSSVKNLMTSTSEVTSTTTEEYAVNGQVNGVREKPVPRYTLNSDAAVFTPSWLPKPNTTVTTTDSRSSIFTTQDSSNIWTPPQQVSGAQQPRDATQRDDRAKMKSRCRFWPNCTNKACKFTHPSMPCRDPDNCTFGDRCIFIHPKDANRQGSRGRRAAGGAASTGASTTTTTTTTTTTAAAASGTGSGSGSGSAWSQPRRQNSRNVPVSGSS